MTKNGKEVVLIINGKIKGANEEVKLQMNEELGGMKEITPTEFEKKYNQIFSGGSPFGEPTNIPTNIEGGALGIWVAYSPWVDTLVCN
jgi:hypothetical protein